MEDLYFDLGRGEFVDAPTAAGAPKAKPEAGP
jgi:hypothetical protein